MQVAYEPSTDEPSDAQKRIAALTPRCREVLDGIVAGRSNKLIAHLLGISHRTVEVHRARMMRDLGVRHIAHAIALAIEDARLSRDPGKADAADDGSTTAPRDDGVRRRSGWPYPAPQHGRQN